MKQTTKQMTMNGGAAVVELFTRQQCKCETKCDFGAVPEGA
jgi:hypothetical protein